MLSVLDALVEWLDAARRWGRHVWLLRLVMLVSAVLASAVLWSQTPNAVLGVLLAGAGVLGLVWARGQLPLLFAAGVVLWSAVTAATTPDGPDVLLLVPVALGLVGWHAAAGALTLAQPWARVAPGVWRRLGVPAVLAVAAVLVGALLAWAAGFVVLPAALTLVAVVVVLLV
uniref:hypothetical protein n=1 Tax=Desertihabitans aurantiacus TaxID=2282477 RepID=UPI0018E52B70